MGALQGRRLMTVMPVVAALTILSGLRLYWIMSDGFSAEYMTSRIGAAFGIAGLLAIVAFVLGLAIVRPAMARAGALAQRLATIPEAERASLQQEIQRVRSRGASLSLVVSVLVVLAAAGMAVARYVCAAVRQARLQAFRNRPDLARVVNGSRPAFPARGHQPCTDPPLPLWRRSQQRSAPAHWPPNPPPRPRRHNRRRRVPHRPPRSAPPSRSSSAAG